jgi:uncharacterized membrane protein YcaP (DUF421 family)
LETNGNLSVFLYPKERPATAREAGIQAEKQYLPVTLVSDGKVMEKNLRMLGKDRNWVEGLLKKEGATVEETWLLLSDAGGNTRFYRKEEKG